MTTQEDVQAFADQLRVMVKANPRFTRPSLGRFGPWTIGLSFGTAK